MKINLEKMTLDELKSLQKDVQKAISNFETRQRDEALMAARAAAKEKGFSLDQLLGTAMPKKGKGQAKNPPKYAHPDNPSKTWNGRGRQPGWIKAALEEGKSLDEFTI